MDSSTDRLISWKKKLEGNTKFADNSANAGSTIGKGGMVPEGRVVHKGNVAVPTIGRIAQGILRHFRYHK